MHPRRTQPLTPAAANTTAEASQPDEKQAMRNPHGLFLCAEMNLLVITTIFIAQ
jgi:hypothetical protein